MMLNERLHLRPTTASEQTALFEIHQAVYRAHIEQLWGWDLDWQQQNFAREFAAATPCVIEVDGHLAGYLQIQEEDRRIYVQNIVISGQFQGQGIGSSLLRDLQTRAAARQIAVELGVFKTNPAAQRLYARLGFRQIGETSTHIEMRWTSPDDLALPTHV